jgi:hypothetical protein
MPIKTTFAHLADAKFDHQSMSLKRHSVELLRRCQVRSSVGECEAQQAAECRLIQLKQSYGRCRVMHGAFRCIPARVGEADLDELLPEVIVTRARGGIVGEGVRVATEQKVGFSYVLAGPEVRQLRPEELTQSLQRKSRQQCARTALSRRSKIRTQKPLTQLPRRRGPG